MTSQEMERQATMRAMTVDPTILPFPTAKDQWQTWVNDQGQWIFIEKAVVGAVTLAFDCDKDVGFNWVGEQMLGWLTNPKNTSPKPRTVWKIRFGGCPDVQMNFGIFQNQCFVFMPRTFD